MSTPSAPVSRTVNIYINQASAERSLENLQKKADKMTDSIEKGTKAGKDMTAEIEKLSATKAKIEQLEGVVTGKLAPSFNQVKARVKELQIELDKMSRDAPGYAEKFEAFETVNKRFIEMKASARGVGQAMDEMKGKSNSFLSNIKTVAAGTIIGNIVQSAGQALFSSLTGLVSGNAKLSDEMADIKKSTGLAADQVERLDNSLRNIDTRDTHEELERIAVGLGQIGQAVTPQVVEAIDHIVVALGDEFGGGAQEITTVLGTLRNNLQDIQTGNYAQDMLHLGNALNELGAQGLATAPVVVDFANRLAGIASTFGATSGQILGLSAALQELGVPAERGATAVTKLLQKLTSNTDDYARIAKYAGITTKDFVNLVNTDVLGALTKFAEGARKAGSTNQQFGKILSDLDADGSGTGEVLSKLAKNADLLSDKIDLATKSLKSSSSITEEFTGKNTNLAAVVEKVEKKLYAAFTNSTVLAGLKSLITGFANLIGAIDHSHDAVDAFRIQQEKVNGLEKNIVPLIDRYDQLSQKAKELGDTSKLSKDDQNDLQKAIKDISDTIPSAITQFGKYGEAISLSSDKAREYIRLQKLVLQEKNRDAIKEQEDLQKTLEAQVKMEASVIKKLDDSRKAQPGDVAPRNQARIDQDITTTQVKIAGLQERLEGVRAIIRELRGEPLIDDLNNIKPEEPKTNSGYKSPLTAAEIAKAKEAEEAMIRFHDKIKQLQSDAEAFSENTDKKELQRIRDKYADLQAEADAYFRKFGKHLADAAQLSGLEAKELDAAFKRFFEKHSDKEYTDTLQGLSNFFNQQRQEAGHAYADGILDKEAYQQKLRLIDEDEAKDKAQAAEDYKASSKKAAKDAEDAKTEELQKGIANRERIEREAEQNHVYDAQRRVLLAKRGTKEELDAREQLLLAQFQLETLHMDKTSAAYKQKDAQLHRDRLDGEKEFNRKRAELNLQVAQQLSNIAGAYFNYLNQRDQEQLDEDRYANDQKKTNLQKRYDDGRIGKAAFDKQMQALDDAQAQKEQDLKLKKFQRDKALGITNGIISTANAVLQALASAPPPYSFILAALAGAAGAVQVGTIAAQKPPKYEKGGVARGARHSNGGISLINADGTKVGEMEDGEPYMILSRDTMQNNAGVINDLLDASINGGGRPIRPRYLYQPTSPLNTSRIQDNMQYIRMYGNGGVTSSLAGNSSISATGGGHYAPLHPEVMALLQQLLDQGVQGKFVWTDFEKMQKQSTSLKKAASYNATA